jgi:hypothetical protein
MKKLSRTEAARLSKPEAERYAEWLCEQEQVKIDAGIAERDYRDAMIAKAAHENAEQAAMITQVNARMGVVALSDGTVIPADQVPRRIENQGAISRFGVRK